MKKIETDNITDRVYSVYLFLLVFNTINKGFSPFGIDFRAIIFTLSAFFIILILSRLFKHEKILSNSLSKWIILLYAIIAVTTTCSDIAMLSQTKDFHNLIVLNVYNFMNILVVLEYRCRDFKRILYNNIVASVLFLVLSQIVVLMGISLPFSNYYTETTASVNESMFGILNIVGISNRIDGYGIDPNYVSLIMILFICLVIEFEKNKAKRNFFIILASFSILVSFSRTIILSLVPVVLVALIYFRLKKNSKKVLSFRKYSYILVALISIAFIGVSIIKPFNNLNSMTIRYSLWDRSILLSEENKYMGAGLGAFREFSLNYSGFYVQAHSTMFQLISEHGIVSFIVFCIIIAKILNKCDRKLFIAVLTFFVWSFTYETMYIPHLILFLGIIPKVLEEEETK